jgi:hypothetical protein
MRRLAGVCECGCGTAITGRWRPGREERRFAVGHNTRKHVMAYCHGQRVRVYVHDGRGWCSGCRSWVPVIY